MVKGVDGTISVQDKKEIESKKRRLLGAVTGGLIGLVGGPVSVAVGALTTINPDSGLSVQGSDGIEGGV